VVRAPDYFKEIVATAAVRIRCDSRVTPSILKSQH
jgi:hypothetical protein